MHRFIVDPMLLIRAPAYSYADFNALDLRQLLQNDFFKASLFLASESFYKELRKKDFDYDLLASAARLTLWKYLNRMCFRALPYGFFASYSQGSWGDSDRGDACRQELSFDSQEELIILPDYKLVLDYINSLDPRDYPVLRYTVNNSLYSNSKELRFISQTYTAKNRFGIVQLKVVPGLKALLNFIRKGRSQADIIDFLLNVHGDEAPVNEYFQGLVSGQVILSELSPNVTGTTYHQRCLNLLNKYNGIDSQRLSRFSLKLNTDQSADLSLLNEHIGYLLDKEEEKPAYSLYQRNMRGGLDAKLQSRLLALIQNMDKVTAGQQPDTLVNFKKDFLQKYDQQEVPLMLVMDPETGIGYENMASAFDLQDDDLIDQLRIKKEDPKSVNWGPLAQMILKKWNNLQATGRDIIMIEAADLETLPASADTLPPGLFILFKKIDQQIWLDTIGGVSGIELSTRFSAVGSDMENAIRKICTRETEINNDFVFAEIAFSPNDRTANINQRGNYYAYEIPILSHSLLPEPFRLSLDDLRISIRNDSILLRSEKLNRYIIPRLSSAYNYKLAAIPVFRFLCDLQFQGLKSNLNLTLESVFPGLNYYPRLQLEDTVLSPATWNLSGEQLQSIQSGEGVLTPGLNIPPLFSLKEGDNFLVFSQHNEEDLVLFRKCISNKKSVTITEYTVAEVPDLKDKEGKPFASQYVACVINQEKSYLLPKSLPNSISPFAKGSGTKTMTKPKRTFLPGEEWIFMKLYVHYTLADKVLINIILPVIKKYKKDNPSFKWFFIRYLDPDYHLRLRFFNSDRPVHDLLYALIEKLQHLSKAGKISKLLLDSYDRELEKYSMSRIADVESFFHRNTEFILSVFEGNQPDTNFRINFAVNTSLEILGSFISDKKERTAFLNDAASNMSEEFIKDKEVLRKLDARYRKIQTNVVENQRYLLQIRQRKAFRAYKLMLEELVTKTADWDEAARYNLLANLIHLHINRIFENKARQYELMCYHFMKKHQAFLNNTTSG